MGRPWRFRRRSENYDAETDSLSAEREAFHHLYVKVPVKGP